jgi:hypothetical protein
LGPKPRDAAGMSGAKDFGEFVGQIAADDD